MNLSNSQNQEAISYSHSECMSEILDNIKSVTMEIDQLEYEFSSIKKRRSLLKSGFIINFFFLIIILCVDSYFTLLLTSPGGSILASSIEMWVALIVVAGFTFFMIFRVLKASFLLFINHTDVAFNTFLSNKGIHTLVDETRFCNTNLSKYRAYLNKLRLLEDEVSKLNSETFLKEQIVSVSETELFTLLSLSSTPPPTFHYNADHISF